MENLPKGIHKKKNNTYALSIRRNGKRLRKVGKNIPYLLSLAKAWHAELDRQGVPPTRVQKKAEFQSSVPGVRWKWKKWGGSIYDRLLMKHIRTSSYENEDDCIKQVETLYAQEKKDFETEIERRIHNDPFVCHLERAPADVTHALRNTVYCLVNSNTKYQPIRAVKSGNSFKKACEKCHQGAKTDRNGITRFCIQHGGGYRCLYDLCPYNVSVKRNNVYDGYCVRCFCSLNKNDERAIKARGYIHAKEQEVKKHLQDSFPQYLWTFDKVYNDSTGKNRMVGRFRPDARTTCEDRVLIVEVDEDSHGSYMCSKEREREESFVAQAGQKTVVLIRFNPDKYVDFDGKTHPSCFKMSKEECIVSVNPTQKTQWAKRIEALKATISYILNPTHELPPNLEDRPCLTIELFYDNISDQPETERIKILKQGLKEIGKRMKELNKIIGA
jgi:hypothetical protein